MQLKNLITWNNGNESYYTIRDASKGLSELAHTLGARVRSQSLYEASMLFAAGQDDSLKLGFYLPEQDFTDLLYEELYIN